MGRFLRTSDLVRKLRTCSQEERREVAMELARTSCLYYENFYELIRMVEGRRRHLLRWYNFNDQLIGVEALGKMNGAILYLRSIYSPVLEKSESIRVALHCEGSTSTGDSFGRMDIETFVYPLARGELAKRMKYKKITTDTLESVQGEGGRETRIERDELVHQIFSNAIEKIERNLGASGPYVNDDGPILYD